MRMRGLTAILLVSLVLVACGDSAPPAAPTAAPPAPTTAPERAPGDVPAAAHGLTMEPGMDRPGSDYRDFDLDAPDAELCRAACRDDDECRAYTYVAPGVQGEKARCWLKNPAPDPEGNECCTSGAR